MLTHPETLEMLAKNHRILCKGKVKPLESFYDFIVELDFRNVPLRRVLRKTRKILWAVNDELIDVINKIGFMNICDTCIYDANIIIQTVLSQSVDFRAAIGQYFLCADMINNGINAFYGDYTNCKFSIIDLRLILMGKRLSNLKMIVRMHGCSSALRTELSHLFYESSEDDLVSHTKIIEILDWCLENHHLTIKDIVQQGLQSGNMEVVNAYIDTSGLMIEDYDELLDSAARCRSLEPYRYIETLVNEANEDVSSYVYTNEKNTKRLTRAIKDDNIEIVKYLINTRYFGIERSFPITIGGEPEEYQNEYHLIIILAYNAIEVLIWFISAFQISYEILERNWTQCQMRFIANPATQWLRIRLGKSREDMRKLFGQYNHCQLIEY
ncbi:Hypothetical protein POVR1_LOCUS288 [uncultured virus]|nr:Hypothetical protein POVR1_LOCUS288 [uncultured virus]